MYDIISKEFVCNDCGPTSFFVVLTREKRINYKHTCFWCGGKNVDPSGIEEIIEGYEVVTYLNNKEIKRRRKSIKHEQRKN